MKTLSSVALLFLLLIPNVGGFGIAHSRPTSSSASPGPVTTAVVSKRILIYGPSMVPGLPNEQSIAAAAGHIVTVADAAAWSSMTTAQFAAFDAIVFGDPNCLDTSSTLGTADANKSTWSAAITGPKIIIGTDPIFHLRSGIAAAGTLISNGVNFAASGPGTGLYVTLSCYYHDAPPGTPIDFLSAIGGFRVQGQGGCPSLVTIAQPNHPAMAGLSNASLSNWSCSIHEFLFSYPSSFEVLATGDQGLAYIIAVGGLETPATLAKQVVGGDYQSGAKGWDWSTSVFVGPNSIQTSGYHWSSSNLFDVNSVLDCSGLVFWSYNKSFGATKYQRTGNPVYYEGADGQYRNNTVAVSEANLSPGDLMFFHFEGPVGFVSHVAMYVGCCGPNGADVVSASSPTVGITWRIKDQYKSVAGFVGFGRVTTPKLGIRFAAHSPIGLIVTDPEGFTITPDTRITTSEELLREIPGVLYYSESDIDDDGRLGANVSAPTLKIGSYLIQVTPKLDALPTDTYSLDVEVAGQIITLAQNVTIRDIPSQGYVILATGSGVTVLDTILQDDSSGNIFRFNSTTGDYQFSKCNPDGFTLEGKGSVTKRGCGIFLQDFSSNRRVLAQIDTCQHKGTASAQVFSRGTTFTIIDRNTTNDTGTCP